MSREGPEPRQGSPPAKHLLRAPVQAQRPREDRAGSTPDPAGLKGARPHPRKPRIQPARGQRLIAAPFHFAVRSAPGGAKGAGPEYD